MRHFKAKIYILTYIFFALLLCSNLYAQKPRVAIVVWDGHAKEGQNVGTFRMYHMTQNYDRVLLAFVKWGVQPEDLPITKYGKPRDLAQPFANERNEYAWKKRFYEDNRHPDGPCSYWRLAQGECSRHERFV